MDDFEAMLIGVIDEFLVLQKWSKKPENSRRVSQVFSVILELDRKLKVLRKMDRFHPLQELAREIRTLVDTREFRAVLLAAFNWRSAQRQTATAKRREPPHQGLIHEAEPPRAKKQKLTSNQSKHGKTPRSSEATAQEQTSIHQFTGDVLAFLAKLPPPQGSEEYLDFYRAGRRLPGSYGSNQ
jgi:hypothetical protein